MQDPTPSEAIADNYDAIVYDALPHPVTHPDHVAAVVTMFGLDPPAVTTARVLEVGCNDGSNLLPMAARLPDASFTGCDIAPGAIRTARDAATALGLANVAFVEADLSSLQGGPYDYIIAHGVYSWVPAPVRDALFALAQRTLSGNGILFTSYSTYPGGYIRRAAWEVLRWHTRAISPRDARVKAAREMAALLGAPGPAHEAGDAALRAEFVRIAGESDSMLFHDTLAEPNEPVWFRAFVEHAGLHGLTYVAEALPSMMAGGGLAPRVREFLASKDRLAREQYLDFARVRRFRQSLLCRSEAGGDFPLSPVRLTGLFGSASLQLLRATAEGRLPAAGAPEGDVLRRLFETLIECAPATLAMTDLLARLHSSGPTNGSRPVDAMVLDAWVAGFVQLHACPPRAAVSAASHPRAWRVARWQAGRRDAVTNLRHETIRLPDPFARTLLALCDGTRDRESLALAIGIGAKAEQRAQLDDTLTMFARYALLERDEGD
jgi:2-polyprenyl-3-methyl-5-hydroxy-6-metoxy-1,4-benzoquinol methylase